MSANLGFSKFPWSKVPRYIVAQIFGSFIAGLLLVGQYHPQLSALAAGLRAKGISPNSLGGPGSVLCSFPEPTETNYGYLVFIEFFVDSFIVSYTRDTVGCANTNTSEIE